MKEQKNKRTKEQKNKRTKEQKNNVGFYRWPTLLALNPSLLRISIEMDAISKEKGTQNRPFSIKVRRNIA